MGGRRFELADADRSDETLHEARKQSEYLGKALDTRAGQPRAPRNARRPSLSAGRRSRSRGAR
jgi:hypothetical protein